MYRIICLLAVLCSIIGVQCLTTTKYVLDVNDSARFGFLVSQTYFKIDTVMYDQFCKQIIGTFYTITRQGEIDSVRDTILVIRPIPKA